MEKQKTKFVLSEATVDDINKQLKINMVVIVILISLLVVNTAQFMKDYNFLYGFFIAIMAFFLFIMAKSRTLLTMRKQALTE